MDNIYLKIPSELDEDNYYNYINEFKKIGNDNTVFCIPAQNKYKRWLKMVRLASRKSVINDGQIYLYFLMENDKLIGHIAIRDKLNFVDCDLGNIGGAIRPTMRNKGYGRKMLSLALKECSKMSLEEIYISCDVNNIPSNKNIIDNGGIMQKIIFNDNKKYRQYKIKIKER